VLKKIITSPLDDSEVNSALS